MAVVSDAPRATPPHPRLDHGAIGNGRVLALVSPTSAIEWLCLPRFDSPSVFGSLLDQERGGSFSIAPESGTITGTQRYIRNSNVLVTTFDAGDCAWEVVDFAPRIPVGLDVRAPIQLVRLVRPLRGRPMVRVRFDPRPDYARTQPVLTETGTGIEVQGGTAPLVLQSNVPIPYVLDSRACAVDRPLWFSLTYGQPPSLTNLGGILRDLEHTIAGWQRWSQTCALPLFEPERVLRSALCLKLHAYQDTGAIIAAATTSIPEAMGTPRTWDYRYCWLRDAAFVVEALRRLSHLQEGEQFLRFLRDVADSGPLQPLYGIDGRRDLEEMHLPHLAGFGGNGHVRIGNHAMHQRQNDLMGEVILCLHTLLADPRIIDGDGQQYFPLIERLVEEAITAAPTPDTGIWEYRTTMNVHTFSRAMCWAAISRGARLAHSLGRHATAERWEAVATAERSIVLADGFSHTHGFFTQALKGRFPDAANLLLATIGIIDARDPRFARTVEAYQARLMDRGLMMRYRNEDDFGLPTSAFTICSFWMAEALALVGRLDDAVDLFRRVAAHENPVGLFSEDIDPATGALLGNFPQAYTHVGLIHAAITIGELLEARDGQVRAWA
ncbi:MAG: glycoside hydrolase family 15 protein [Vicinamibacterales bacterium]